MTEAIIATDPFDELVAAMEAHPGRLKAADFPTEHRFTPGLYSRTVLVAEGRIVVSRLHKTEHPFCISKGVAKVWTPDGGVSVVQSPFLGVTKAGDRRVVLALSDLIWTTFHATPLTDIPAIEKELFA